MSTGHAHESDTTRDENQTARREAARDTAGAEAVGTAARTATISTLSRAGISRLQRSAGSRAVSRALVSEGLAVQRHAEGTELPTEQEDVAEVTDKAAAPIPAGDPAAPDT